MSGTENLLWPMDYTGLDYSGLYSRVRVMKLS